METGNNDNQSSPLKLDFQTLLRGVESYKQEEREKEATKKTEEGETLKLDFKTLLRGIESYKQELAQPQTSTEVSTTTVGKKPLEVENLP
ncbi:MAG: hypothetical protein Q7K43_01530, partial [Candidatus Woesearchaeota archaeon]|nr:hypothetical protein [Candidatus Woesearchaeota archaeon]